MELNDPIWLWAIIPIGNGLTRDSRAAILGKLPQPVWQSARASLFEDDWHQRERPPEPPEQRPHRDEYPTHERPPEPPERPPFHDEF